MTVQEMTMTVGEALEQLGRELEIRDKSTRPTAHYQVRRIMLPNGWAVSCGFGTGHYCSNYGPEPLRSKRIQDAELQELLRSTDCEIGIFTPDEEWFIPHYLQVWSRVPSRVLLAVVDAVAMSREGGPCPCPDCVRARMNGEPSHD